MKINRIIPNILMMVIAIQLVSCAKEGVHVAIRAGMPNWEASKEYSYAYERSSRRGERIDLAQKGIDFGEACIQEAPENPACYYYHAINTGLYYKSKVVGYEKGLKSMIADCEKIISIDPSYEHGGAYRMLGMIYTEVPAVSIRPEAIVRDLDKAIDYLNTAIGYDPSFPENYIAISKAYLKAGHKNDAAEALIQAKQLLPEWRGHLDYPFWKNDVRKLSKKLKRRTKSLQSQI